MANNSRGIDFSLRDKVLLEGEAQYVAADIRRFFSGKRIEREAVCGQCERVGREVHDGALQALTAVSLQLAALERLVAKDPFAAREIVKNLKHVVGEEQCALRAWLTQPSVPSMPMRGYNSA